MKPSGKSVALLVVIALATGAVYLRTLAFDFVSYDDGVYVTANAHVRPGLTWDGVVYAFTTGETGTWQPLALLSHMLDCTLYGQNAAGHHATSAALHALNTLLLGLALLRMTGAAGPSLFVAAVFGLHPLHVESVAWISERKDVLSTLFFMLALLAYARWTESLHKGWLALATAWLAIGLMAKPMLVTLPCVLLLLDYWPLGRVQTENKVRCIALLVAQKLPMFALALASSIATIAVQRGALATTPLDALPLTLRLENAASAYLRYIGKTVWPADLLIYYPHPREALSIAAVAASVCGLLAITAAAWFARRRAPYAIAGWLWYLVTLLPVIGIVQVGTQAMADRYTYIPMIGLLIAASWGARDWAAVLAPAAGKRALALASAIVLVALAGVTWPRIGVWRDSETLYRSTLETMPGNAVATMGLGLLYVERKQYAAAIPYLDAAIAQKHCEPDAHYHLGIAHQGLQQLPQAETHYRVAVALEPDHSLAWNNLGVTLDALGNTQDALTAFMRAVDTGPRNEEAAANLVRYLVRMGRVDEARREVQAASERMPDSAELKSIAALLGSMAPPPAAPAP